MRLALPALMLLSTLLLTGCEDPCVGLDKKADPAAQALMQKGYEVSIEVGDAECELQPNGQWEVDA